MPAKRGNRPLLSVTVLQARQTLPWGVQQSPLGKIIPAGFVTVYTPHGEVAESWRFLPESPAAPHHLATLQAAHDLWEGLEYCEAEKDWGRGSIYGYSEALIPADKAFQVQPVRGGMPTSIWVTLTYTLHGSTINTLVLSFGRITTLGEG